MGLAKEMKLAARKKSGVKAPTKYGAVEGADGDGIEGIIRALDSDLLTDAVCAVWTSGDAIMLGSTRDGGAVTISVYEDGERVVTAVCGSAEKVAGLLSQLLDAAKGS